MIQVFLIPKTAYLNLTEFSLESAPPTISTHFVPFQSFFFNKMVSYVDANGLMDCTDIHQSLNDCQNNIDVGTNRGNDQAVDPNHGELFLEF